MVTETAGEVSLTDVERALGTIQPQPDHDDFGRPTAMRPGEIAVGLRHNWLAALWWRGAGVVDGRLVLDVSRQPPARTPAGLSPR